jgi:release factor glutamine methyltransferase
MEKHVLDFEPEMALFVEDDAPMIFYEAIIDFADTHLNDGGQVMVEIHENLGEQVMQLFLDAGYSDVKIVKDLQGKNRIVWAK